VKGANIAHSKFADSPEIVQAMGRALASSGPEKNGANNLSDVMIIRSVVSGIGEVAKIPRKLVDKSKIIK